MKKTIDLLLDTILLLVLLFSVITKLIPIYVIALLVVLYFAYEVYKSGFKKTNINSKKNIIIIQAMMCFILLFIYYILGSKLGYQENIASLFKEYVNYLDYLSIFLIVIITELTRYRKILDFNSNPKKGITLDQITFFGILILLDILIYPSGYSAENLKQVYVLLGLIIGASITKNLYLNYLSEKTNYHATIIYRLILEFYLAVVPVVPNINLMIKTILFTLFPYVSFIVQDSYLTKKRITDIKREQKLSYKIGTVILVLILIVFIGLVSGELKYTLIAVGSESMSGSIEKGDAIIYKSLDKDTKIDVGDIIVYQKNGITIIHRVDKIYDLEEGRQYKTKGDANPKMDNWVVSEKDILGVVKKRIKWLGYPAVMLSELF